ncbi:MAG: MFS transporter [Chloroflexota bacterium]
MRRAIRENPLILPIYLPAFLTAVVMGIASPTLPLFVRELQGSYAAVGLVLAGRPLGMLLTDIPGSMVLRAFGQKRSMLVGTAASLLALLAMSRATAVWEALLYQVIVGIGFSLFAVARHAYLAANVSVETRGRAVALLGGVNRIGVFVGPTIGGLVASAFTLRVPFLLMGVVTGIALIVLWIWMPPDTGEPFTGEARFGDYLRQLLTTLGQEKHALGTAGMGQLMAQAVRATRRTVIPLYAADVIGLDVAAVGLLDSIGSAIDMTMFYPTGIIMDKYGRKFAVVPSFLLQGIGIALIPLTWSFGTLAVVAGLIGFGNGLSSGTMMTIGADLAPKEGRGEFLGLWRLIGDVGFFVGPLMVGIVAGAFTLPVATVVMSSTGFMASGIFAAFVPETLRKTS